MLGRLNRLGMTMMELLIVIVMIGIMASDSTSETSSQLALAPCSTPSSGCPPSQAASRPSTSTAWLPGITMCCSK